MPLLLSVSKHWIHLQGIMKCKQWVPFDLEDLFVGDIANTVKIYKDVLGWKSPAGSREGLEPRSLDMVMCSLYHVTQLLVPFSISKS